MSNWIEVSIEKEELEKLRKEGGVKVRLFVSPYDVPDAVRGYYDAEMKRFVVEFKYLADEDTKEVELSDCVFARVGVNSERLYALEIDTDSLPSGKTTVELASRINKALSEFTHEREEGSRAASYRLAQDAINEVNERLYADLEYA